MKLNRKYAGYGLFTVGCIIVFSIVLFPKELIKNTVIAYAYRFAPAYNLDFDQVGIIFPPGVRLSGVRLFYSSQHIIDVERISIYPHWFSMLSAKPIFGMKLIAYEGTAKGSATIENNSDQPKIAVTISDIQVKDIPVIRNRFPARISGILNGDITFDSDQTNRDLWDVNLRLSDGDFKLDTPILNQDRFYLSKVTIVARVHGSNLVLRSCMVNGEQFDATLSGTGSIRNQFEKSTLALAGELRPKAGFLGMTNTEKSNPLKFRIRGPVENLQFLF